ncbi:CBS domain-containing protein [Sneathiella chungangensis]|uniref:CBS domain-containing protein n=1 Tax=Sneathiella chungangensis TaxID=1418234 RepID=A0A845MJ33_9PROT|nr:CBS domain-containing protein [Sneathiella chungangensis]MZR22994.1 CBS domain-containing protein [Sneathiella chungangensis]
MNVAGILKVKGNNVITADPSDSISAVSKILGEKRIGAVLIVDGSGKLCGVLSERDIVRGLCESGDGCLKLQARDLMTADLVTTKPSETIDNVMALMTEKRIRHLPVLDDGSLAGFISIGDVVKSRMDEVEREAAALRDYIATG